MICRCEAIRAEAIPGGFSGDCFVAEFTLSLSKGSSQREVDVLSSAKGSRAGIRQQCFSGKRRLLITPVGHLTEEKISHLANGEIRHMADASGGSFLYTGDRRIEDSFMR